MNGGIRKRLQEAFRDRDYELTKRVIKNKRNFMCK